MHCIVILSSYKELKIGIYNFLKINTDIIIIEKYSINLVLIVLIATPLHKIWFIWQSILSLYRLRWPDNNCQYFAMTVKFGSNFRDH